MKKDQLQKSFFDAFPIYLLCNGIGGTFIVGTARLPTMLTVSFAYFPAVADFQKITEAQVVCRIRNIKPKI